MAIRRQTILSVLVAVLLIGLAFVAGRETASTAPATTTPVPTTTTTTWAPSQMTTAIWPTIASSVRYATPTAAAGGFALAYLHMTDPVVGAYRAGDTRSGEVPVRSSAGGPETTVLVRQVASDASWWVIGAATQDITINMPSTLARVNSPLTIAGVSTAYEAVVNISLREDDVSTPLATGTTMGGSMGQLRPFHRTLAFQTPTSTYGALVLYTISAKDGSVASASVIRLRYH
ncbi:MAG TPA: Gmad2 immunoglobulin-like domain-containing protein [Acidimicrobiales bacterium]|nr:Gmad2 immunoglobulin-like domain-containing protein [Acidimicrobiales bacterium]